MDRWARLAHQLGTALLAFASESVDDPHGDGASSSAGLDLGRVRGHRQRQILGLPAMLTERGMTTWEVRRRIDYDQPNVYNAMHDLMAKGLVELAETARPQRWRRVDWQASASGGGAADRPTSER